MTCQNFLEDIIPLYKYLYNKKREDFIKESNIKNVKLARNMFNEDQVDIFEALHIPVEKYCCRRTLMCSVSMKEMLFPEENISPLNLASIRGTK